MDPAQPRAGALAIRDGKIAAVGDEGEARASAGDGAQVVDVDGGCVLPAFIDAHHHFCLAAFDRRVPRLELPPGSSIQDVLAAVERHARDGEGWLRLQGYDATKLRERRPPLRDELDEACGHRPVLLIAFSFHEGVLNSRGLEAMGYTPATPDSRGGALGRRRGRLTGEVIEQPFFVAEARSRDALLADADDAWIAEAETHARELLRHGIARVADAAVPPTFERLYRRAAEEGRLPVTVHRMPVAASSMLDPRVNAEPTGSGPDGTPQGAAKLFLDGGERCAVCLTAPQLAASTMSIARGAVTGAGLAPMRASLRLGAPKLGRDLHFHTGIRFWERDALTTIVRRASEYELQVAQHAVGNEAIGMAIEALERGGERLHDLPGMPRLEHVFFGEERLARRLAAVGAAAVVQPYWVYDLGDELLHQPLPRGIVAAGWRTLRDAGVTLAGSSDYPVSGYDVLAAVRAAATRRTLAGQVLGAEEAITVEDALRAYTAGAARALGVDDDVGTLAPGKRADLVVLSGDPLATDPDRLESLQIRSTWVGGEPAYEAVRT